MGASICVTVRTRSGVVKLTDFGLARGMEAAAGVTGSGEIVGTIAYIAPEIFSGEPASFQSDMYALGVTLHWLLTGRGVFAGTDRKPWFLTGARLDAATLRTGGVPAPFDGILERLLAQEPEGRYADYAALIVDLRGATAEAAAGA